MKKFALALLFSPLFLVNAYSQEPSFALHLYNPIDLFQKAGVKVEYRTHQMGFLIGAIQYYGTVPSYPGTQLGLEWRHYSIPVPEKKRENFFYARMLVGHQDHLAAQSSGFMSVNEIPQGDYYGAGAGVGRHYRFNHLFLDLNAGLKIVASTVKQESAFYLSGPASYLDLHFNCGFQF